MAKITMPGERLLYELPITLPTVGTSGYVPISVPFTAGYIAVLNNSAATVAYKIGRLVTQPADAVQVLANIYLSLPTEEGTIYTLFWSSSSPLSSTNNQLMLIFSNEEINLQGGSFSSGGVSSNVNVTNPSLAVSWTSQTVGVTSMPASVAQDGTDGTGITPPAGAVGIRGWLSGIYKQLTGWITTKLGDGTNTVGVSQFHNADNQNLGTFYGIMTGGVDQVVNASGYLDRKRAINAITADAYSGLGVEAAALVAYNGTNYDRVRVDAAKNLLVHDTNIAQAATAGIGSTNQVAVATTATVILNSALTGKSVVITNNDANNTLYIGASGVTTSTGFPIGPKGVFSFDIISGSTITVYGIGSAALTAAYMVIN